MGATFSGILHASIPFLQVFLLVAEGLYSCRIFVLALIIPAATVNTTAVVFYRYCSGILNLKNNLSPAGTKETQSLSLLTFLHA